MSITVKPGTRQLSPQDISFAEEISEVGHLLNFTMKISFNVDAVFGTHVCTDKNDDWLNLYANYDMKTGDVCGELEIALHHGDGREAELSYPLNAEEKEILRQKMDAYCQEQTGQTLAEYSIHLMTEEMALPTQSTM